MKQRTPVTPECRKRTQKKHERRATSAEHTYRMRKAEAKRPVMHRCPNCGLDHGLGELDLIPAAALGHFDKDGLWMFDGETKVFWDGQRQEHEPARFICLHCDTVFDLSGRIY